MTAPPEIYTDTAMRSYNKTLKTLTLIAWMALIPHSTALASEEQARVARDIVKTLEAYAVYKMGQYDLAFERYLSLAENGRLQGMLNVANMYAEGKGVEQSDRRALNWYRQAAELGDRYAMTQLAGAYREGKGVEKDIERAGYWDRRSLTTE